MIVQTSHDLSPAPYYLRGKWQILKSVKFVSQGAFIIYAWEGTGKIDHEH